MYSHNIGVENEFITRGDSGLVGAGLADLQVLSTVFLGLMSIVKKRTNIMWIVIDYDRGCRGSI